MDGEEQHNRTFMVNTCPLLFLNSYLVVQSASRTQCNIAFGDLVVSFSNAQVAQSLDTLFSPLLSILNDLPFMDFDKSLSWKGEFIWYGACKLANLPDRLGIGRPIGFFNYLSIASHIWRTPSNAGSHYASHI